jgi:hypothetical protein
MQKKYDAKLIKAVVKLNNEANGLDDKLGNIWARLVESVVVEAKVKTVDQFDALRKQVQLVEHTAKYGSLTKADKALAKEGELDKEGFKKNGEPTNFTSLWLRSTTNSWNLIARAIKADVALMDKGKVRGQAEIIKDFKQVTVKMNSSRAIEMKDSILNELTKVAHDIKKYKNAREGLENGLVGLLEDIFGYEFS